MTSPRFAIVPPPAFEPTSSVRLATKTLEDELVRCPDCCGDGGLYLETADGDPVCWQMCGRCEELGRIMAHELSFGELPYYASELGAEFVVGAMADLLAHCPGAREVVAVTDLPRARLTPIVSAYLTEAHRCAEKRRRSALPSTTEPDARCPDCLDIGGAWRYQGGPGLGGDKVSAPSVWDACETCVPGRSVRDTIVDTVERESAPRHAIAPPPMPAA